MKWFTAYVVSEDPIVLLGGEGPCRALLELIGPRDPEIHFIRILTWSQRRWRHVARSAWAFRARRGLIVHHACNEPVEYQRFRRAGLRAIWCNQNACIPEAVFRPMPGIEKRFDAVYNAVAWPYKRMPLARKIESLRLITATDPKWHDRIAAQGCGHAEVNKRRLSRPEVAEALNEARCGLALSAEEGTMLAATEYLLCGLPVVSTPSLGGRDVWFDEYNSRIVEPDADAVAKAVAELKRELPDPEAIRQATLERMRRFRSTLVDYVNREIIGDETLSVEGLFGDGLGLMGRGVNKGDLPALLASHRSGGFAARELIGAETPAVDPAGFSE